MQKKRYKDKHFDPVKNADLIANQHAIHNAFRGLVKKNGIKTYIENLERRNKVVQFYLEKFNLIGTSVESFWRSGGACILIGKGY